jgi:hypothetical protein
MFLRFIVLLVSLLIPRAYAFLWKNYEVMLDVIDNLTLVTHIPADSSHICSLNLKGCSFLSSFCIMFVC